MSMINFQRWCLDKDLLHVSMREEDWDKTYVKLRNAYKKVPSFINTGGVDMARKNELENQFLIETNRAATTRVRRQAVINQNQERMRKARADRAAERAGRVPLALPAPRTAPISALQSALTDFAASNMGAGGLGGDSDNDVDDDEEPTINSPQPPANQQTRRPPRPPSGGSRR